MNTPVSFPIAKLLKEKRFEQEERPSYLLVDFSQTNVFKANPENIGVGDLIGYYVPNKTVNAPTIAEVVMWLYEKHGIWINVWSDTNLDLPEWKTTAKWFYVVNCDLSDSYNPQTGKPKQLFNSPTEAYEAAIEYTLNILI